MAKRLEDIAQLPDPLGRIARRLTRPNGLRIQRIATPIGVIGMIYESRPNVGGDAAGIGLKSGNAVIPRGGSESAQRTGNQRCAHIRPTPWPPSFASRDQTNADRAHVVASWPPLGLFDLITAAAANPRRTRAVEARVPCARVHAEGLCHVLRARSPADPATARNIVANAKMRRTGICGATETLLIDRAIAPTLQLPAHHRRSAQSAATSAPMRQRATSHLTDLAAATDADFQHREWLDAILSVAVVDGVDAGANPHRPPRLRTHLDAIIAEDATACGAILRGIDSAVALPGTPPPQFCDGGEFGFRRWKSASRYRTHSTRAARSAGNCCSTTTARLTGYGGAAWMPRTPFPHRSDPPLRRSAPRAHASSWRWFVQS